MAMWYNVKIGDKVAVAYGRGPVGKVVKNNKNSVDVKFTYKTLDSGMMYGVPKYQIEITNVA